VVRGGGIEDNNEGREDTGKDKGIQLNGDEEESKKQV